MTPHGKTSDEQAFAEGIIAPRAEKREVSWWVVVVSFEEFTQLAKQELPGIQAGTFGRRAATHEKGFTL